jgi:hypothetical protein
LIFWWSVVVAVEAPMQVVVAEVERSIWDPSASEQAHLGQHRLSWVLAVYPRNGAVAQMRPGQLAETAVSAIPTTAHFPLLHMEVVLAQPPRITQRQTLEQVEQPHSLLTSHQLPRRLRR